MRKLFVQITVCAIIGANHATSLEVFLTSHQVQQKICPTVENCVKGVAPAPRSGIPSGRVLRAEAWSHEDNQFTQAQLVASISSQFRADPGSLASRHEVWLLGKNAVARQKYCEGSHAESVLLGIVHPPTIPRSSEWTHRQSWLKGFSHWVTRRRSLG